MYVYIKNQMIHRLEVLNISSFIEKFAKPPFTPFCAQVFFHKCVSEKHKSILIETDTQKHSISR